MTNDTTEDLAGADVEGCEQRACPAPTVLELVADDATMTRMGRVTVRQRLHRFLIDAQDDSVFGRTPIEAADPRDFRLKIGIGRMQPVANTVRTPAYPNVPTVAEAGQPGLTIDGLVGLFGHPFMPMALRERIAADIKEVMESDPIIKDRLTRTAQLFAPGGPAEFGASIETQRATVAAAAKAIGLEAKQ